jgi:replicative DNA helicase
VQNQTAEIGVIAAALHSGKASAEVIKRLQPEDFADDDHKAIFTVIQQLASTGGVDEASLEESLRASGELNSIGGAARLQRIVDTQVDPDILNRHIDLVFNNARVRRLVTSATEIIDSADSIDANDSEAVSEAIASSQRLLTEMTVDDEGGLRSALAVGEDLRAALKRRKAGERDGVLSGFATLDSPEISYGLENENLYVFMGVPGCGKTTFALNIMRNIALPVNGAGELVAEEALPVAMFSLEMSSQKLLERMVVSHARARSSYDFCFTASELKQMKVEGSKLDLMRESFTEVKAAPIFLDDVAPQSIDRITAKSRALKISVPNLALIVVDYIQLIRGTGKRVEESNRANSLTDIAYALKNLAKELHIPVVVTGQVLEKEVERRGGKLLMTDIKESGGIAQAANLMAGLEITYENGQQVNQGWIGFPILKNRDGDKWRENRINFEGKFFYMDQDRDEAHERSPY